MESLATLRPGLLARTTVWLPLHASLGKLVDCVNLNHCVPTRIRAALVPTGMLILVWVGPWPRSTIPLLICSVLLMLKLPADSITTCPTGQLSSAAWMPAVPSPAPLPQGAASTVAPTVLREGT